MAPEHKKRISEKIKLLKRAFDLAFECYSAREIRKDNMGAKRAFEEWLKIGQEHYESKPR